MIAPDKLQCTCGFNYHENQANDPSGIFASQSQEQLHAPVNADEVARGINVIHSSSGKTMDASFVQVPASHILSSVNNSTFDNLTFARNAGQPVQLNSTTAVSSISNEKDCKNATSCHPPECSSYGYVQDALKLHKVVTSFSDFPALCRNCIVRLERALENDSERLLAEAAFYEQTIQQEEANVQGAQQVLQRAVRNALQCMDGEDLLVSDHLQSHSSNSNDVQNAIEDAFLSEIDSLEKACQQYRDELLRLTALQKEQALLFDEVEQIAECMAAEQNALELEARAFDNDQERLARLLAECQNEMERLSSPAIRLPTTLIKMHIDVERGLRYPLINELRLAYRPKGDVDWTEIQTAWALASNLLLMIATVFNFQSQSWKIVPLSHCAKLIYSPPNRNEASGQGTDQIRNKGRKNQVIVFNLGHPKTDGSKALLMWNALLYQITQHVIMKNAQAVENGIYEPSDVPSLPFDISTTSIGGILLSDLSDSDDTGWSRVIHFMASNLLWLSNCASNYILHQVLLFGPLGKTSPTALARTGAD